MVDLAEFAKEYSLHKELSISLEFIKKSLSILQEKDKSLENYFTIFLLLSTGLERYLKVILCLFCYEKNGRFKTEKELKKYGHDIHCLKNEILETHFPKKLLSLQKGKEDFNFLKNNLIINELLKILSDFAQSDRYIFLNNLVKHNYKNDSPVKRWEFLELKLLPEKQMINVILYNEDYDRNKLSQKIIQIIEKFLRAITRTITLSELPSEIKEFGKGKWDFVLISDKDFGKTQY